MTTNKPMNILRVCILFALVGGCESSRQRSAEQAVGSEARLAEDLAAIDQFATHPSPVVRGNVIAAKTMMKHKGWSEMGSPCFLVGASCHSLSSPPDLSDSAHFVSVVMAVGAGPAADEFVFIFETPDGEQAELRYPNLWADAEPMSLGFDFVCFNLRLVPPGELCRKGETIDGAGGRVGDEE